MEGEYTAPMAKKKAPTRAKPPARVAADVPRFFRLNIEVGDLGRALRFYGRLLGIEGREGPGSRAYFQCGPVTLQVVQIGAAAHPAAKCLYFEVSHLERIHARAKALRCLSKGDVHDDSGGRIVTRPWGERSFYAEDPWDNPLCFVQEGTRYAP